MIESSFQRVIDPLNVPTEFFSRKDKGREGKCMYAQGCDVIVTLSEESQAATVRITATITAGADA